MSFLIVACGNSERGDDAAGLLVAGHLRSLGIEAREHSGEGLSLMESWVGAEHVILVDAVVTGSAAGAILVWNGRTAPLARDAFRCSTHAFGVAEAVELARALDRLPPRLTIYGIEAASFTSGTGPSDSVRAAAEETAAQIAALVKTCTNPD